jgi:hypothetical protein
MMYAMTTTSERIAEVIRRLNALTGRGYRLIGPCEPLSTYDIYVTDAAGRTTKLFAASSYYAAKRYLERLPDEEERRA